MKKDNVSIDASCLIAIQTDEKLGQKFKKLLMGKWNAYCTEIAILEFYYVLCRKLGWDIAKTKLQSLKESGTIQIKPINDLIEVAAQLKCQKSIAIADCLTIALACEIQGKAIFNNEERELKKAIETKPFDVEIFFLENLKNEDI